jgi:hypothetical protein
MNTKCVGWIIKEVTAFMAFPIRTDCVTIFLNVVARGGTCVTIFLNVVARGGTVRWNRHITPDLCLATSWLHDLIHVLPEKVELLLFS